jgi:hypothetical protein
MRDVVPRALLSVIEGTMFPDPSMRMVVAWTFPPVVPSEVRIALAVAPSPSVTMSRLLNVRAVTPTTMEPPVRRVNIKPALAVPPLTR